MKLILWLLGLLLTGAITEEVLGWVTPVCRLAVRRAARRLPRKWRARYTEEWEAELLALPGGPITRIMWTLRTRLGVTALSAELGDWRQRTRLERSATRLGAAVLLLALAPAILLLAGAVKLSSRGPVLVRQMRVGRSGQSFQMIMLRTTYVDGSGRPNSETDCDPPVTPVGRFIRRYFLDEIPQLLNVVRGRGRMAILPVPVVDDYLPTEPAKSRKPGMRGWDCLEIDPPARRNPRTKQGRKKPREQ